MRFAGIQYFFIDGYEKYSTTPRHLFFHYQELLDVSTDHFCGMLYQASCVDSLKVVARCDT